MSHTVICSKDSKDSGCSCLHHLCRVDFYRSKGLTFEGGSLQVQRANITPNTMGLDAASIGRTQKPPVAMGKQEQKKGVRGTPAKDQDGQESREVWQDVRANSGRQPGRTHLQANKRTIAHTHRNPNAHKNTQTSETTPQANNQPTSQTNKEEKTRQDTLRHDKTRQDAHTQNQPTNQPNKHKNTHKHAQKQARTRKHKHQGKHTLTHTNK